MLLTPRAVRALLALVLASTLLAAVAAGCGSSAVPSPFGQDAGTDGDAEAGPSDAPEEVDPRLGGPCMEDSQCDDGIDCTFDDCDESILRCRFTPDDVQCVDDVYCDGQEICDPKLGCHDGPVVACSDDSTCTIDECIESTKSCEHAPRDVDQDGDSDWNCGGGDCNDLDPAVSAKQSEICGNSKDDDCDGSTDEADCKQAEHDLCADALDIDKTGQYALSWVAAASDYAATCAGSGGGWRDVVAALIVPPGPAVDLDVIATVASGAVALAAGKQCGDASSEIACSDSSPLKTGGAIARLRLRSLAPGAYPLYLFGSMETAVTLKVTYLPATTAPTHETCGTAAPITPGVSVKVGIVDAVEDLASDCASKMGELVYGFSLAQPMDLNAYATSLDGYGSPALSLWVDPCATLGQELACNVANQAHLVVHSLAAGDYYLAVSATAPSELDLLLELTAPTPPPPDETCSSGATLAANTTVNVDLTGHADDLAVGCLSGAADAAYALELGAASDVLVVGRISDEDVGAVGLSKPNCAVPSDIVKCASSANTPVRARAHQVAAGSYRVFIETQNAAPASLTAFVRPALAPVLVAFADTCAAAVKIGQYGGFFQGNTANANADYEAGCDLGSQGPGGAGDQMLQLALPAKKRVILDMQGSSYSTLLVVRQAATCPGSEVPEACSAGYYAERSFLDLTLDPGDYYVQIDGYANEAGPWFLDVFVVDP